MSEVERGRKALSLESLAAWAGVLGLTTVEVLTGCTRSTPSRPQRMRRRLWTGARHAGSASQTSGVMCVAGPSESPHQGVRRRALAWVVNCQRTPAAAP